MYNEELKQTFINEYLGERIKEKTISETTVKSVFNKTTLPFEKKYDKDAALFSPEQILEMFKAKNSRSLRSLLNTLVILRQYTNFALNKHLSPRPNNYDLITSEQLKDCVSSQADKVILTREDINDIQRRMLNDVDKAILECLFIGISGKNLEDLTYLDHKQVDYSSKTVTLKSGKVVQLTTNQMTLLHDAFHETESVSYLGDQSTSPVYGIGQIYKLKANALDGNSADKRFRWVQRRFRIWKDYFDLEVLTMKTVTLSGLVHSVKIGMAETGLELKKYLRTPEGQELALRYEYESTDHYVEIVYDRVKKYL